MCLTGRHRCVNVNARSPGVGSGILRPRLEHNSSTFRTARHRGVISLGCALKTAAHARTASEARDAAITLRRPSGCMGSATPDTGIRCQVVYRLDVT